MFFSLGQRLIMPVVSEHKPLLNLFLSDLQVKVREATSNDPWGPSR